MTGPSGPAIGASGKHGPGDYADPQLSLMSHLLELRRRLLISVGVLVGLFLVFFLSGIGEYLFTFLTQPLRDVLAADGQSLKMVYLGLHQAFWTYTKVALYGAFFLSSPVILVQIWLFIAPGLYRHERRVALPFLVATPVLFFLGAALAYWFVLPVAFEFFLSFNSPEIESLPSMTDYLSLVMTFIFMFGMAFELPVGLLLAIQVRMLTVAKLVHIRRYAIVIAFIVAAILTPPDPFSQTMLAIPLLALYEISILGGRMIEKRRARSEALQQAQSAHEDTDTSAG
jgi:sec-independent protein translocase protein TatC